MTEKTFNITFSEAELQALINMMDAAVRAQGLQIAAAAATLTKKITDVTQQQLQQDQVEKPKEEIEL